MQARALLLHACAAQSQRSHHWQLQPLRSLLRVFTPQPPRAAGRTAACCMLLQRAGGTCCPLVRTPITPAACCHSSCPNSRPPETVLLGAQNMHVSTSKCSLEIVLGNITLSRLRESRFHRSPPPPASRAVSASRCAACAGLQAANPHPRCTQNDAEIAAHCAAGGGASTCSRRQHETAAQAAAAAAASRCQQQQAAAREAAAAAAVACRNQQQAQRGGWSTAGAVACMSRFVWLHEHRGGRQAGVVVAAIKAAAVCWHARCLHSWMSAAQRCLVSAADDASAFAAAWACMHRRQTPPCMQEQGVQAGPAVVHDLGHL